MTRRISRQVTFAWNDETLPDKARALVRRIVGDDSCIEDRIGALLGNYRLDAASRDSEPTREHSMEHADKTIRSLDALVADLSAMPERFQASIAAKMHPSDDITESGLTRDLQLYRMALSHVLVDAKRSPPSKRNKLLEHRLLAATDTLFEPYIPAVEARAKAAASVLRAAGVKWMPVDAQRARAAVLAIQKR